METQILAPKVVTTIHLKPSEMLIKQMGNTDFGSKSGDHNPPKSSEMLINLMENTSFDSKSGDRKSGPFRRMG